jgi:excisionase family DNA binding protein
MHPPWTPRGMSRDEAARYVGIGVTLFDEMVRDGRMPGPKSVNSRKLWDRHQLDEAFNNLPDVAVQPRKAFALI